MFKRICLIFAAFLICLLSIGNVFAQSRDLECENIEYLTETGKKVTEIGNDKIFAKVSVKNNTESEQQPAAVVASYESGVLNGIWYNTTDTALQSGESGMITVEFYPVTSNENTVIKTVVIDSLKRLEAQSEVAEMLSDSVSLREICVNGKAVSDYSDNKDTYLIETNEAFSEITAKAADGGTKVETVVSTDFPSVSSVKVTSSMGKTRQISIVAYNDSEQLKNLIPVTTQLTSPQAFNGTGVTNADGSYTLTGKAGETSIGKHLRYVFGKIPSDFSFASNILRFDVDITADEYYETSNNGKSRIYVKTSDGVEYNTSYLSTKFTQGNTYHLKLLFDTERNCHVYLNDEYLTFKLKNGTGTGVTGVYFGQDSPIDSALSNVLTFKNASCMIYPPQYSLIINGEPLTGDDLPPIISEGSLTVSKRGECTVAQNEDEYIITKKTTDAEQYSINIGYAGGISFEPYIDGESINKYVKHELNFIVNERQTGVQVMSSLDSVRINLPELDAGTYHVSILYDLDSNESYLYINHNPIALKDNNSGTLSNVTIWFKDAVSEETEVMRIKQGKYTVYSPQAVLDDILASM